MMKKVLDSIMNKLQETNEGTLKGGFASIRGGVRAAVSTNDTCNGTNNTQGTGCTNKIDCTQTTNTSTPACTNSGKCFH